MKLGIQPKTLPTENQIINLIKIAHEVSVDILAEAAVTDSTDSFPVKTFKILIDAGFLKAPFPKKYGGNGLGIEQSTTGELLSILKILGSGNLVVGRLFEGHFNAVQLINEYGTDAQTESLFGEAILKNHIFGVWNTEAADGVKIIPTTNGNFRLTGSKIFASGVGYVNRPIVTGSLPDGGWQMFVVPMEQVKASIDTSWWNPLGMKATHSYRVDFSGIELNKNNLIGKANDYYQQPFFSGGAVRFSAVQLGAAEKLLDLTRQFLCEMNREKHSFQQVRLGEMAIAVESGNLLLEKAARIFDEYLRDRNPEKNDLSLAFASMARTAIEQICQDVMIRSQRSIGSRGLMKPYHFERIMRDLTIYLRQAAPDETLIAIGKYVLESNTPIVKLWQHNDR